MNYYYEPLVYLGPEDFMDIDYSLYEEVTNVDTKGGEEIGQAAPALEMPDGAIPWKLSSKSNKKTHEN